jgi:uncharacterized phage-associated protein
LDARAIANLLLNEADARGIKLSNLKLQKLLFLCHAFYLVDTTRPLVRGTFEAWRYGPVHREAYEAFKEFGAKPITRGADRFNPVAGVRQALPVPEDQAVHDVVRDVVRFYGGKSARELVELTHAKNGPWDQVVSRAETSANIGLKITDAVILQTFKYLWFGDKPSFKDQEPNEDQPLIA